MLSQLTQGLRSKLDEEQQQLNVKELETLDKDYIKLIKALWTIFKSDENFQSFKASLNS